MISLIFIYIGVSYSLNLGEIPCNLFNDEGMCKQSGYCQWSGQCHGQYCHLIDEVSACRSNGAMNLYCTAVPYTPLQYVQSCYEKTFTEQKIYYYRHVSDLRIDQIQQTSILLGDLINGEKSITNMFRLYDLDVLSRQNEELNQILDLYISYATILIGEYSHPYYLERIIYEAIQNIRDNTLDSNTFLQLLIECNEDVKKKRKKNRMFNLKVKNMIIKQSNLWQQDIIIIKEKYYVQDFGIVGHILCKIGEVLTILFYIVQFYQFQPNSFEILKFIVLGISYYNLEWL